MTDAEKKLISEQLPENINWKDVKCTPMGNFSQVLYQDLLVGYIMYRDNEPYFKGKGLRK
jgi:hypothetical protein